LSDENGSFRITWEWKEIVYYQEGDLRFAFVAGWGRKPPVLLVPSATLWDEVVAPWLVGRRDLVVARLRHHSGHVLEDTDSYTERFYRPVFPESHE
jgi:hypothetical protein